MAAIDRARFERGADRHRAATAAGSWAAIRCARSPSEAAQLALAEGGAEAARSSASCSTRAAGASRPPAPRSCAWRPSEGLPAGLRDRASTWCSSCSTARSGEDGTVQGLLELAGVPYTGAGVLASAVGMDKVAMKDVFRAHGLPIVEYVVVTRHDWRARARRRSQRGIARRIGFPCFVKPANLGLERRHQQGEGRRGPAPPPSTQAARHDRRIVVERAVQAREVEVAVLGNDEPDRLRARRGVLRRRVVRLRDQVRRGPDDVQGAGAAVRRRSTARVRALAVRAFQAIDCAGMARVDFFVEGDGRVLVNEINTIPGFTATSAYPRLWEASGIPYPELIARLIELALERRERAECEAPGRHVTAQSGPMRPAESAQRGHRARPLARDARACASSSPAAAPAGTRAPASPWRLASRERGVDVHWIGSRDGVEARRVAEAGHRLPRDLGGQAAPLLGLAERARPRLGRAGGRGRSRWRLLRRLAPGARLRHRRLRRAAAGAGRADAARIPVVVHEQTSVPGLANRIAGRFARRIALTFPLTGATFPPARVSLTGNPLRPELAGGLARGGAAASSASTPRCPIVYVTGGAQGAHTHQPRRSARCSSTLLDARAGHPPVRRQRRRPAIARGSPSAPQALPAALRRGTPCRLRRRRAAPTSTRRRTWSSGRSGAGTVNECCHLGRAALYVPLPGTSGDEQTVNARLVEAAGGAVVLPQATLTPAGLSERSSRASSPTARRSRTWASAPGASPSPTRPIASRGLIEVAGAAR